MSCFDLRICLNENEGCKSHSTVFRSNSKVKNESKKSNLLLECILAFGTFPKIHFVEINKNKGLKLPKVALAGLPKGLIS